MTVREGDPTWAGAGLGLPVYHITEAEIKDQVDAGVYDAEVGLAEMALDVAEISQVVEEVRDQGVSTE